MGICFSIPAVNENVPTHEEKLALLKRNNGRSATNCLAQPVKPQVVENLSICNNEDIVAMKNKYEILEKEKEEASTRVKELEKQISVLEVSLSAASKENLQSIEKLNSYIVSLNNQRNCVKELSILSKGLEQKLQVVSKEKSNISYKILDLESDLSKTKMEKENLFVKYFKVCKALEELQNAEQLHLLEFESCKEKLRMLSEQNDLVDKENKLLNIQCNNNNNNVMGSSEKPKRIGSSRRSLIGGFLKFNENNIHAEDASSSSNDVNHVDLKQQIQIDDEKKLKELEFRYAELKHQWEVAEMKLKNDENFVCSSHQKMDELLIELDSLHSMYVDVASRNAELEAILLVKKVVDSNGSLKKVLEVSAENEAVDDAVNNDVDEEKRITTAVIDVDQLANTTTEIVQAKFAVAQKKANAFSLKARKLGKLNQKFEGEIQKLKKEILSLNLKLSEANAKLFECKSSSSTLLQPMNNNNSNNTFRTDNLLRTPPYHKNSSAATSPSSIRSMKNITQKWMTKSPTDKVISINSSNSNDKKYYRRSTSTIGDGGGTPFKVDLESPVSVCVAKLDFDQQ